MIIGAGIFLIVKWLKDGKNEKKGKIGEVNCIFQIDGITTERNILGKDFSYLSSISVFFNNTKIKNQKNINSQI